MKDSTKLVRSWINEGNFDYVDNVYFYKRNTEFNQDDIRVYFKEPKSSGDFEELWELIYSKLKSTKEKSFYVSFGPIKDAPYEWCTAAYK